MPPALLSALPTVPELDAASARERGVAALRSVIALRTAAAVYRCGALVISAIGQIVTIPSPVLMPD